jgi:nitrite reductase/ring-hydroxylating ferredoxin subunit
LSGGVTGRKKISSRYDATRQGGKKLEKDVVDASDGGGGGFLRGWFSKKDDDEDSRGEKRASSPSPNDGRMGRTLRSNEKKEDSVFRKVQSVFSKPEGDEASVSAKSTQQASKPAKATTTDSKKKVDEENIFMKVFPKADNKMGEEVKQDRPTSEDSNPFARFQALQGIFARNATSDDAKPKEPNATNLNPLSSLSKLLALDRFGPIEQWITVFPKTRIMPGQIVPVTVAGLDLLVIASRDGRRLYCIVNSCSHLGTPLETGTLVRLPRVAAASGSASTSSASPQGTLPPPSAALVGGATTAASSFTERDISNLLSQDGCEDCIVCPLHRTAFALESGDVRGEWCPYPPVLGSLMATAKKPVGIATFDVRTRGKFVQVRINTPLPQTKDGG